MCVCVARTVHLDCYDCERFELTVWPPIKVCWQAASDLILQQAKKSRVSYMIVLVEAKSSCRAFRSLTAGRVVQVAVLLGARRPF